MRRLLSFSFFIARIAVFFKLRRACDAFQAFGRPRELDHDDARENRVYRATAYQGQKLQFNSDEGSVVFSIGIGGRRKRFNFVRIKVDERGRFEFDGDEIFD